MPAQGWSLFCGAGVRRSGRDSNIECPARPPGGEAAVKQPDRQNNYESLLVACRALLPETVNAFLGNKVDFLEIEGQTPISACSADWSWRLVESDGSLCPLAPVHYDPRNPTGLSQWGPDAEGAVVVAHRGEASFENIARRAEASGALAVVIVDDDQDNEDTEMTLESTRIAGFYLHPPPKVPAVLVPADAGEELTSGRKMRAQIVRR